MTPTLVVLTDFYAVTNRALSYAAGLAVPLGAHLMLLHTRHDALLAPDGYHARPGQRKTAYVLQQLADEQPVATEVDVSDDELPAAVREAVQQRHPLLVVLGRPASSAPAEDLVLLTALNLLRHATTPLLLVPGAGWDAFPPRRLLLLVDGHPFDLRPHQDVLRKLLLATHGTLDVLHVRAGGDADAGPPARAAVLDTVRANNLADGLTDNDLHQVRPTPSVVDGVLAEAARQRADVLVVVARPHGWFCGLFHDSVAARLLRESPVPVLVLPAEA